jgi:acetyl esterase/lipase
VLLLVLASLPLAPASGAMDLEVQVGGETAHGLLALPQGGPQAIVAILHGYGHKAESHRGHLEHLAAQGYVAFAMDYRGEGFPLRAGADDTIAATQHVMSLFPEVDVVVLYSVSMGTAVAGMVLAELPVFSYWVDNEGLADLPELHTEASLLAPANAFAAKAIADMEAECGGAPALAPACYLERSAAFRAGEFSGLHGVVLTHGVNDGLVPYDQGREMQAALHLAGIPSDFYTVVRSAPGGEGTTITGYSPSGGMGLAGHGTENDDAHALTSLSFALLDQVLAGVLVPSGQERVADAELGTLS